MYNPNPMKADAQQIPSAHARTRYQDHAAIAKKNAVREAFGKRMGRVVRPCAWSPSMSGKSAQWIVEVIKHAEYKRDWMAIESRFASPPGGNESLSKITRIGHFWTYA
jgi:hypothetical protein